MQLIDTHTHIYGHEYEEDRDAAMARAREAGVTRMAAIGAGLESSRAALELARAHPSVIATVGVHPHEARGFDEAQSAELRALAADPNVRAIGEIGLDYHYDFSLRAAQAAAFEAQLALAAEMGRPVVIHMREAEDDVHHILKSAPAGIGAIVMHCFLGGPQEAARWLDLGFLLGIGGAVTFKKMEALRETARFAPLDRILLETDCPYMTPHPHRGRRNEPAYVALVAQAVAEARGQTVEEIAAATTGNALEFYGPWDG